jgi:hypothetical protein
MSLIKQITAVASLIGVRSVKPSGQATCRKCGGRMAPRDDSQIERMFSTSRGVYFEFKVPCASHIVSGNRFVTCDSYRAFAPMAAA